jgi:hypothetical protein
MARCAVLILAVVLVASPCVAQTGKPPTLSLEELRKTLGEPVTVTATVVAIDYDERVVVLRDAKMTDRALYVGEDVVRLKNMKAGDVVTVTYYMSLASRILKPGEPEPAPGTSESIVGTAGGTRPAGTATVQERRLVTVTAVDRQAQTVTVTTETGRALTVRSNDAAKLAELTVGDRVEIILTAAAVVSVTPADTVK